MVILPLAVDTREEKKVRVWEAKSIKCRIADRLEQCNPCFVIETIHINDFVLASREDQKCFIYR